MFVDELQACWVSIDTKQQQQQQQHQRQYDWLEDDADAIAIADVSNILSARKEAKLNAYLHCASLSTHFIRFCLSICFSF